MRYLSSCYCGYLNCIMYACLLLLQIGASPSAYYLASLLQLNLSKYLVMVQMNLIVVTHISSGVCFKAL
jgi:hypothetical protein